VKASDLESADSTKNSLTDDDSPLMFAALFHRNRNIDFDTFEFLTSLIYQSLFGKCIFCCSFTY
jgi:hypothetical protein